MLETGTTRAQREREQAIADGQRFERDRQNSTLRYKNELADLPSLPNDPTDHLTPIQRIAVGHLVSGQSIAAIARAMNLSRSTIHNWMKKPAFARVVEQTSREALNAVATRARNLLLRSTRELERGFCHGNGFEHAMRIVNSRQIWDMANVIPDAVEGAEENGPAEIPVVDGANANADRGATAPSD